MFASRTPSRPRINIHPYTCPHRLCLIQLSYLEKNQFPCNRWTQFFVLFIVFRREMLINVAKTQFVCFSFFYVMMMHTLVYMCVFVENFACDAIYNTLLRRVWSRITNSKSLTTSDTHHQLTPRNLSQNMLSSLTRKYTPDVFNAIRLMKSRNGVEKARAS